jgi:hypothetical protein
MHSRGFTQSMNELAGSAVSGRTDTAANRSLECQSRRMETAAWQAHERILPSLPPSARPNLPSFLVVQWSIANLMLCRMFVLRCTARDSSSFQFSK